MAILGGNEEWPSQRSKQISLIASRGWSPRFAKFVDFPDGTFPSPQSLFTICILGQDPFGPFLDNTVSGKMVGEHPVNIERIRRPDDLGSCRIVFISISEAPRIPAVLQSVRQHSILTVGDMPGFANAGGSIEFILEDNHVRFAINTDAALRSRLKISSKLLALARIVREPNAAGKD